MTKYKFEQIPNLLVIPKRFSEVEFDEGTNSDVRQLCNNFIDNFDAYYDQGIAPVLTGPPGLGKSYAAAVMAKQLYYDLKVPVFWADTVTILNRLMDHKDFRSPDYFKLKDLIIKTPIIVLDDFGHMQEFSRSKELFLEIVNSRYASKRPTIMTMNHPLQKPDPETLWEYVANAVGAAVTRRINLMAGDLLLA